jgi:hypothetical protein
MGTTLKSQTLREVLRPVASPLEKLPEGLMRSLAPHKPYSILQNRNRAQRFGQC